MMDKRQIELITAVGEIFGENSSHYRSFQRLMVIGGREIEASLPENAESSDYSLADWVEALIEFDQWLDEAGEKTRPFREILGYIHCCTLINPPGLCLPKLNVIVIQSLTEYGFDAVSDSQL